LVSPYFKVATVQKLLNGLPFEEIAMRSGGIGQKADFGVDSNGCIESAGATTAPIAIAVALAMGARNIYVAGMDGYSGHEKRFHYYDKEDSGEKSTLLQHESRTLNYLPLLQQLARKQGGDLRILTPTTYTDFFDSNLLGLNQA